MCYIIGGKTMRQFKKEVIDNFGDKVIVNSTIIDNTTYYKLNYSDKVGIGYFFEDKIPSTIFNQLRGSVCILEDGYYKVIYPAMDKFFNLHELENMNLPITKNITLKTVIEKLDGMMILPFIVNGEVYLSSRWNFDTTPVIVGNKYMNDSYKKFIRECYYAGIYLTFELISYESQIKVLYPESEYGLYLVATQNKFGKIFPLLKENDEYYVQSKYTKIHIPDEIKHAKVYDISDIDQLKKFVSSFEGRKFEGVVAFTTTLYPFKLKNMNYLMLSRSKNSFIEEFADMFIDNTIDDLPNIITDNPAFKTVKDLWGRFNKDLLTVENFVNSFNSKKEIGLYLKENKVPSFYGISFKLFDNQFDIETKRKVFKQYIKENIEEE